MNFRNTQPFLNNKDVLFQEMQVCALFIPYILRRGGRNQQSNNQNIQNNHNPILRNSNSYHFIPYMSQGGKENQ